MPGRPTGAHQDPTVCAPAEKAGIEAYIGVSLKDADQEAIRFVVDRSKQAGNDAFRQKNYKGAQGSLVAGKSMQQYVDAFIWCLAGLPINQGRLRLTAVGPPCRGRQALQSSHCWR